MNPGNAYLATEQEKLDYFVHQHNVPRSDFPARVYRSPKEKIEPVRYFVDKFPLFLSAAAVVHFTFVSAGGSSRLKEFRTHLRLYRTLFQHLKEVRMVFIHQDSFHVPAAQTCFRLALQEPNERKVESTALLRYFELRHAWDRREYEKVGSEELVFLNQARKKYSGSRYESLYAEWTDRTRTDSAMTKIMGGNEVRSEFLPHQIDVDPRTFMVKKIPTPGDQPTKSCFHPSRHPLCHPASGAMNREGET